MRRLQEMEIMLSQEEIARRVKELAEQVSTDYPNRELLLVGVLKGAVIFLSDLLRNLSIQVKIDFMAVSSYGADTKTSGVVRILKDLDQGIKGRDVLIVEDIVDTGLTMNYLFDSLARRQPKTLKVVTLLDKPERRRIPFQPDYCGFIIPNRFVVGYGLDFNERYRQLADVRVVEP